MNGAVFFFWFQTSLDAAQDTHRGEFSDAEIAARQAVRIRPSLRGLLAPARLQLIKRPVLRALRPAGAI
jgi:hypothetical protein